MVEARLLHSRCSVRIAEPWSAIWVARVWRLMASVGSLPNKRQNLFFKSLTQLISRFLNI